jgi:hypothetical protein
MIPKPLTLLMLLSLAASAGAQTPPKLPQLGGGLKGYISMQLSSTPDQYRSGVSFYSSIWTLLEKPLSDFQIGLPATWIEPDNRKFTGRLCPPGTYAGDHWPERGPTYRDVFQTIEGGLGFWANTKFGSPTPKYRINGTTDGYTHQISSVGWGWGEPQPLASDLMGIAQLSNRLLTPPDGFTFPANANGAVLGNAWMALPLIDPASSPASDPVSPTGDQSWTLFFNAANFKGPVAFWIPEAWSQLSQKFPSIAGRGMDTLPAIMNGGAMEFNTVPRFASQDAAGVKYSRVPQLHFPVDSQGRTVLMQDIRIYSRAAIFDSLKLWAGGGAKISGKFNPQDSWPLTCTVNPINFKQGDQDVPLTGFDATVQTAVFDNGHTFGLQWKDPKSKGLFPAYYRQDGKSMTAIPADQVPASTGLTDQAFTPARVGEPYVSPTMPPAKVKNGDEEGAWNNPGPVRGPFYAHLTDGSVVTYYWYRFVDQPSLQHLHLNDAAKQKLQALVERIQKNWSIKDTFIPPPSSGRLAALDSALVVTPPHGLKIGYVPIVTNQEMWTGH